MGVKINWAKAAHGLQVAGAGAGIVQAMGFQNTAVDVIAAGGQLGGLHPGAATAHAHVENTGGMPDMPPGGPSGGGSRGIG